MLSVMDDQEEPQQNNKQERVDELDVIGGVLIIFLTNMLKRIKNLLSPRKVE